MPGIRSALMINGLPVVAAPVEVDLTVAEQLRTVLLDLAGHGHATIIVDMTRTQFCDSAGLSVLIRAHRRALSDGGELRVVIPVGSPPFRVFTLIGLHHLIPWFAGLDQAIAPLPPGHVPGTLPPRPPIPVGVHPARQAGPGNLT